MSGKWEKRAPGPFGLAQRRKGGQVERKARAANWGCGPAFSGLRAREFGSKLARLAPTPASLRGQSAGGRG